MMIDIKEVSKILAISEKTIYRWITKREIPVYKIGGTYRFNRVELLEWATSKKIPVSPAIFDDAISDAMPSLTEAITTGGIHYHIPGNDKESVIRAIVKILPLPDDVDKEFLVGALIARENLGTTAIGDGIAIPHVRNPIIFHVDKPVLALCFLEQAIDFNALDHKPVDTVLTIITNSIRSHLHILSRLSFALNKPEIRQIMKSGSSQEDIIKALTDLESTFHKEER
jgi:PTS system nitrogen regulatory IIA component